MRATILRFFSFDAHNVTTEVYFAMLGIYFALLVVTLLSIRQQRLSAARTISWALVVIAVPIGGIALYCFACLATADISFLQSMGLFRKARSHLNS